MIIKVDNRESELLKQIQNLVLFIPSFKQLKVEIANLQLGDIIISDNNEDKIIIERKCLNDLIASIKDGRYEEQSYRLNGLDHHNHNIFYMIEGDVNKPSRFKDNNIEKLTLYSAMFSLNYFKGFSVTRTLSIEESAIVICNMANKLSKSERKGYYENVKSDEENVIIIDEENVKSNEENVKSDKENVKSDKDYIHVVKRVKKENITPENIAEIMLCQIPGISSVTAIAIMDKFKTIPNLINEVQQNDDCLKDISYINSKGQSRKINKTSLLNIVKYLLKK